MCARYSVSSARSSECAAHGSCPSSSFSRGEEEWGWEEEESREGQDQVLRGWVKSFFRFYNFVFFFFFLRLRKRSCGSNGGNRSAGFLGLNLFLKLGPHHEMGGGWLARSLVRRCPVKPLSVYLFTFSFVLWSGFHSPPGDRRMGKRSKLKNPENPVCVSICN